MTLPFNFRSRRAFLKNAGLGCGSLAMTSLLNDEGILSKAERCRGTYAFAHSPTSFCAQGKIRDLAFHAGQSVANGHVRLQTGTSKTGRDPAERR